MANNLRLMRHNRLLTMQQLADKSGVSLRTLVNVERGRPCQINTMRKIMIALEVALDDLKFVFPDHRRPIPESQLTRRSPGSGRHRKTG